MEGQQRGQALSESMHDAVFESTSHAITSNLYQIPSIYVTSGCSMFSFTVWASLGAQMVKNLPAVQKTWV